MTVRQAVPTTMSTSTACWHHTALLLIDIQNDFLPPNGSLAVPNGDSILPTVYKLLNPRFHWKAVVASQDYHPKNHLSFASTHNNQPGNVTESIYLPFTEIEVGTQNTKVQLWPDHCIEGSEGSELEVGLQKRIQDLKNLGRQVLIVRKGQNPDREEYSVFKDEEDRELDDFLKSHQINHLVCLGLATDYCLKHSVKSALRRGYKVSWVSSGTAAVGGLQVQQDVEQNFLQGYPDGSFELIDVDTIASMIQ